MFTIPPETPCIYTRARKLRYNVIKGTEYIFIVIKEYRNKTDVWQK